MRCEDVRTHVSVGIRPRFRLTRNRVWNARVAFLRTCARASIRRNAMRMRCEPRPWHEATLRPRQTQPRESTAPVSPPDTPHPQTHPSWSLRLAAGVGGREGVSGSVEGVCARERTLDPTVVVVATRRWRTSAPSYAPSWKSCVPTEREGITSWPTIENACRKKKKKNMAWCREKVQGSDDTHHPRDKKNVKGCKTRRTR